MIRKYHNYKPQTTQCHHEEEPLNHTRHQEDKLNQIKQSNQLSLPHQDSHNGSKNKQKVNNNRRTTALELTAAWATGVRGGGGGGLDTFYWYQIFALDSAVVEIQEIFSSHGGPLTNAMYHHGETL